MPENNDENGYNGKMPPSARFLPAEHTSVLSVNPHVAQIKPVKRSRKLFLLAGLALVLVSSLGFYFLTTGRTTSGGGDKKRIAVLPLKPINTESRDDIYEVGIADSLIYKLSSMKGLVVRPLSAVRKYKDLEQDPLAAGREQQVDYILESSYQLAGGHIRVTSRLFNVASGQIEETYKSEKDAANVFAMQDAIAGQVGNFLLARFAATSSSPMARRGTNNVEAYRLYLQGMYLYGKRTPKASKKAVELLDQAVRLDPNYALAWAGKAHAHRYRGNLGRDTNTYVEYQNSAVALNEALLLDKDLSEAYSALCENKYYYEWDFAGAERECKRAIELDPNSSMAHEIYGRYLFHRGHVDEAIIELKTAIALDPTSLFNQRNLGIALYYAGRYDEAVGQFKQVIATDENFTTAYLWLRNALEMQGNYSEAFEWLMKAQKALSADEETVRLYKTAYQTSGYQGVLRAQAERFEKGNSHFYIGAILNAQIGNKNKAFEYLEKSYQRREWGMNSLLVEPHLGSLRSDPRFDELVKRIGLK
ncbi:MAG: tetratricopeptide repeat protein [Pyrinomonadaceae bacterium]